MVSLRGLVRSVIAVGVAFVVVSSTPAFADTEFGSSRVGSQKIIGNTDFVPAWPGERRQAVRAVGTFAKHKKNSVKLKKLKLCYNGPEDSFEYLLPNILKSGSSKTFWTPYVTGGKDEPFTRKVKAQTCTTYKKINMVFKAKPGKELFYVHTRLGMSQAITLNQFKR